MKYVLVITCWKITLEKEKEKKKKRERGRP